MEHKAMLHTTYKHITRKQNKQMGNFLSFGSPEAEGGETNLRGSAKLRNLGQEIRKVEDL
jgi:hypothetical protein